MSTILNFEAVKPEDGTITLQTPRSAPGLGRIAYFRLRAPLLAFVGPKNMRLPYSLRPTNVDNGTIKINSKFDMELSLEDVPEFEEACRKFDEWVVDQAFARKTEFFGNKAQYVTTRETVMAMYSTGKLMKAGKAKPDGGAYPSTIRFKVSGSWANYVSSITTRPYVADGKTMSLPDRCNWFTRPLSDPVGKDETKFWMAVPGKENTFTDKLQDGAGGYRLVGPQDCVPGSKITPVFTLSSLYITEGFGVTVTAKEVYITPRAETADRPIYSHGMLPGVNCVTDVDMTQ